MMFHPINVHIKENFFVKCNDGSSVINLGINLQGRSLITLHCKNIHIK